MTLSGVPGGGRSGSRPSAAVEQLRGVFRRRNERGHLRTGSLALLDQAVISGCNFLTNLLVARALGAADFGLVTLAYTALFAANTVQGALFVGPHAVLSAGGKRRDYLVYTSSIALGQVGFAGLLGLVAILGAILSGPGTERGLFLAFGVAAIGWQLQEFARRILYVEDRIVAAVVSDIVSYGGQLGAVALLVVIGRLDEVSTVVTVGATSAVAAAIGLFQIRHSVGARPSLQGLVENWHFGKWLIGGEVAFLFSTRLYAYFIAALLGAASAGVFGAALLVLNPLNVLIFSIGTVVPIQMARVRSEQGEAAARRLLARAHLLLTPPIVLFCVVIGLLGTPILHLFYGGPYDEYGWLVAMIALFSILRFHAALVATGLSALRQSQSIFIGHAIGAVIGLPLAIIVLLQFGIAGAPIGMTLSALTYTGVWWWRYLRSDPAGPPVPAPSDASPASADETDADPTSSAPPAGPAAARGPVGNVP